MAYDVKLTCLPPRTLFDLKGKREALTQWCGDVLPPFPAQPSRMSERGGRTLVATGPDHWLLIAPRAEEQSLIAALRPDVAPADLSLVLISDTLSFFALSGPDVGEVMAVVTPLDLHRNAFPKDGAGWTEAFGTKALIRRTLEGYEIAVDRSYADWFEEMLQHVKA